MEKDGVNQRQLDGVNQRQLDDANRRQLDGVNQRHLDVKPLNGAKPLNDANQRQLDDVVKHFYAIHTPFHYICFGVDSFYKDTFHPRYQTIQSIRVDILRYIH